MRHHTKDKGDSGVGFVVADLLSKNIQVALPISEHLPFDCIAISEENRLIRLSVKYRAKDAHGGLCVALKSNWNDRHGTHIKRQNKAAFDATAVYCPDTGKCYYIRNDEAGDAFVLRMEVPKNGQHKGVRLAADYQDPRKMFDPPVAGSNPARDAT
jgi:hypothetical protein